MFAPLEALRPKQWTKNLLLFVGVIFSQHLSDMALLQRAMAGFVAFSLLSGSVYVLNDLMDVEADRQHPKKCKRPSKMASAFGTCRSSNAESDDHTQDIGLCRASRIRWMAGPPVCTSLHKPRP